MPMYNFRCQAGHLFERYLHLTQFRERVRCAERGCRRVARLAFVPSESRPAQGFAPVVIHRRPDGHLSFPAHSDAPLRQGYQRVELRTIGEVRKLEREVNALEARKHVEHMEREEATFNSRASRQAELRQLAQHMSPFGRDFAHLAMEHTNRKSRSASAARFDPGFRVAAFSDDRSSMDDYRDKATGWKNKR